MEHPKAWKGDYAGLSFYPSRGVCQVRVEFPLEEGTAFVAAFGSPLPKSNVQVAIARINPDAQPDATPERRGGKLAQRAAILCNEGGFQRFIAERVAKMAGMAVPVNNTDPEDIAVFVRNHCGVKSRAELDHDVEAARKFNALEMEYRAWLSVPA